MAFIVMPLPLSGVPLRLQKSTSDKVVDTKCEIVWCKISIVGSKPLFIDQPMTKSILLLPSISPLVC